MEEPEKVISYLEFARGLNVEEISDAIFLTETEHLTHQEFLIEAHQVYYKYYPENQVLEHYTEKLAQGQMSRPQYIMGIRSWIVSQSPKKNVSVSEDIFVDKKLNTTRQTTQNEVIENFLLGNSEKRYIEYRDIAGYLETIKKIPVRSINIHEFLNVTNDLSNEDFVRATFVSYYKYEPDQTTINKLLPTVNSGGKKGRYSLAKGIEQWVLSYPKPQNFGKKLLFPLMWLVNKIYQFFKKR